LGSLLRGCDSRSRAGWPLPWRERLFDCLHVTPERPFAVKPWIEQPSAERVFAIGGRLRYGPNTCMHLEDRWLTST